MKIPVKELAFIKGHRNKTGSIGPHQIDLPDIPENKRLMKSFICSTLLFFQAARGREKMAFIGTEVHLIVLYCRMN